MAEIAENQEKVFEYFNKLEPKLRMEIIDEMQFDDRCRMTRCSKQCNQEAKASKNYVYELNCVCWDNNRMKVEFKPWKYGFHGFRIVFVERDGKKFKICTTSAFRELWEVELDSSADLYQCAIKEFKNLLQKYQNTVKEIYLSKFSPFNEDGLEPIDYEIDSLNSLEKLIVNGRFNILQILSKLRHPLTSLSFEREEDSELLANCKQIYQVEQYFCWPNRQLTNEQFQRLSAKRVCVNSGKLTEKDIFKFIRSWQDGTIGKNIELYNWTIGRSTFDRKKFLNLLRVPYHENGYIEIKHFTESGKSAILCNWSSHLSFRL